MQMAAGVRRMPARRAALLAAAGAVAASVLASGPVSARTEASDRLVDVIVQGLPGAAATVFRDVENVGGAISARLAVVNGVAARVPADAMTRLRAMPGVRAVTSNDRV